MNSTIKNIIPYIFNSISFLFEQDDEAHRCTWWILEHITKKSQAVLLTKQNYSLTDNEKKELKNIIHELCTQKKPLQYVLGFVPFLDLKLKIKPPILIPRPETENWCSKLTDFIKKTKDNLTILDLCTGSGCIAISLAKSLPNSIICATDISEIACELTKENSKKNQIKNIKIIKSNLFDSIPKDLKFDLIVSNPPYVDINQWKNLNTTIKRWEDKAALVAKENGLEIINKIINQSHSWLKNKSNLETGNLPQLGIEISPEQKEDVIHKLRQNGYKNINVSKDLSSRDRFITANL